MTDTRWGVFKLDNDEVHVAPLDDIREHILSENCECDPEVKEQEDGGIVVVHSAWDFREVAEALEGGTLFDERNSDTD